MSLAERIRGCKWVVGVDGGINHCYGMGLELDWIVGDFDSAEPSILEHYAGCRAVPLERAKDETDLEVAIAQMVGFGPVVVFGGLGGRLDHMLGNLFLLLRYPGRVFLVSEDQWVFASSDELEGASFALGEVGRDAQIVVLDRRGVSPLMESLHLLERFSKNGGHFVSARGERVCFIDASIGRVVFPCHKGQTVSLLPFQGPADKIVTEGLQWEFTPGKLERLDRDFIGISNVCLGEQFSIQLGEGVLLCIMH